MRPEAVLGAVAPVNFVLARTEAVAVAVWGITVFETGFEFTVASISRDRPPRHLQMHRFQFMDAVRSRGEVPDELLRVGLSCNDGSTVTNLRPGIVWGERTPAGEHTGPAVAVRVLVPGGGGGSDRSWTQKYWCWPLPPPGPLTFVCEWPAFGIGETRHDVDAEPILAAALRCVPIWR